MCFCITFGSILAPFSHQSACFPAPFSSLFRSCSAKGALWAPFPPFGSTLVAFWHPFGSHLGSLCSLLAPFWSPLARRRSVWLRRRSISDTFGFRCFPFVTLVLKFSLFPRFPSSSAYVPNIYIYIYIYIFCAASRGPATALNHGSLWLMGKSQILSRCKT